MSDVVVRVSHVSKRYDSGPTAVTAVRDVSFDVMPGQMVLIMGPSGSGKTTLLSIIGALVRPTEGVVEFAGTPLNALSEGRLADFRLRFCGFVFQDFNLLPALSAQANVALVGQLAGMTRRAARTKAAALLGELGLSERLEFRPEKLSGGEKQRVALARALINDPMLILADEPTGNLDSRAGQEVAQMLRRVTRARLAGGAGSTLPSAIVASHDTRIEEFADCVLWLEDGALEQIR
jgi:putative ABC transport system ATP-binding protein